MRTALTSTETLEERILLTGFTADIDGDGEFTPLGDGIMAMRFMNGMTGTALVQGAVNPAGRRTDPADIVDFLNTDEMQRFLDVDGDGTIDPATDGVLFLRRLAGFNGDVLTGDATAPEAIRTSSAHVEFFIDTGSTIDDTVAAEEGVLLTVSAADGVLQNDPVGATVVSFDSTSELGATVNVSADGSYTYDPSTSVSLNLLTPSQSAVDSFTYTINAGDRTQVANVEVAVSGRANGTEDLVTTDDNTAVGFPGEKGVPVPQFNVLDNDPGTGLTVIDYTVGEFGARVVIDEDGEFRYDPTVSAQLNALNNGNELFDIVRYTTEDVSGQQRESIVTVKITGVNDIPSTKGFFAEMRFNDPPITLFPLDFVSDIDADDELTITAITSISADGQGPALGVAVLNNDGTVTYDPSPSSRLADLPAGDVLRDVFVYDVTDAAGATKQGELVVFVTGDRHAPVAVDDDYTSNGTRAYPSRTPTFIQAEIDGLLQNDSDIDGDVVTMVSVGEFTTQRGATVTIKDDGSFIYDPLASTELRELEGKKVVRDTFTYTVNDSAGDGKVQAKVIIDVVGSVDPDRNPVFNLSDIADTSNGGADISVFYDFGFSTSSLPHLRVFDRVAGTNRFLITLVDNSFNSIIDSITIIGTPEDDVITASTATPLILLGGNGNDSLSGGTGNDSIAGGSGRDILVGNDGIDTLSGGPGRDTFEIELGDTIEDLEPNELIETDATDLELSGDFNQTPTPSELNEIGQMTARLDDFGIFGSFVTITGPSGYGFQLNGEWTVTPLSGGRERFTTDNAILKTEVGDIEVGAVTLNTEADSIANSGPLITSSNGVFSALSVLTDNPIIDSINSLTGIGFNSTQLANQGLTFGLKLGSELMANELSGFAAPLNNAIPYLFAQFNIGTNLINFGGDNNVTVSSSANARVAFVFDPADPFFWLKGLVNDIGGSIGFSKQGNIPFRPNKRPDTVSVNQQIYGNISGSIKVPFQQVFRLEGELVFDYDRGYGPGNNSGSLDNQVSKFEFYNLFKGDSSAFDDLDEIVDLIENTELGINGAVTFTPDIGNSGLGLSLPIGSGTAMYYGGHTIAFKGGTDDPFSKIPVLRTLGVNPGQIESDGYLSIESGDFRISARATQGNQNFGPFSTTGDMTFVIDNSGVDLSFGLDTPIASARFSGRAAFQDTAESFETEFIGAKGTRTVIQKAGTFFLQARISPVDLDFVVVNVNASMTLTITNEVVQSSGDFFNSTLTYKPGDVQLRLNMSASAESVPLDVDLSAEVVLTIGSGGSFNFRGTLRGTIAFGFGPVSAEFEISNAGIRLEIPWLGIDTHVPIPGLLHVDQPAIGEELLDHQLLSPAALPGVVDEAIRRLERTGLSNEDVALLKTVEFRVQNIDDRYRAAGYASGRIVTLDSNAAGHGWFIDSSPEDDAEFDPTTGQARPDSAASGRIDLLSAVIHELTHILEFSNPDEEFNFGEFGMELIEVGQRFGIGVSTPLATRRD